MALSISFSAFFLQMTSFKINIIVLVWHYILTASTVIAKCNSIIMANYRSMLTTLHDIAIFLQLLVSATKIFFLQSAYVSEKTLNYSTKFIFKSYSPNHNCGHHLKCSVGKC